MEIWETIIVKLTKAKLQEIIQEELEAELEEFKVKTSSAVPGSWVGLKCFGVLTLYSSSSDSNSS